MNNGINSLSLSDPGGNILCGEFSGRDDLTMALVAEPASKIEAHAFENCRSLRDVILENSVRSIGDFAFYNCPKISYVSIPSSLVSIGSCAFGCNTDSSKFSLRDIVIRYEGSESQWNNVAKSGDWISDSSGNILPHRIIFSHSS